MRTAIFFGLIYIGDAIGTPNLTNTMISVVAIVVLVFVVMDVVDFVSGATKHE